MQTMSRSDTTFNIIVCVDSSGRSDPGGLWALVIQPLTLLSVSIPVEEAIQADYEP